MLSQISPKHEKKGQIRYEFYLCRVNMFHNCIDITTFNGYVLQIDCAKAEEKLKTTPCSECALNALAIILIFPPLVEMQILMDAEDNLEI